MRAITCLLVSSVLIVSLGLRLAASEHEAPSVDVDRNTASLKPTDRQLERADSPPDDKLLRCLSEWERASAALRPLTKTERQQVALNRRDRYSGHELAVICDLCGPVHLSELLKHYRWVDCRRQADTLRLTAEPRDMAASLFFREFQIALDAASRLPRSIEFTDRRGKVTDAPVLLSSYLNVRMNSNTPSRAGDTESALLDRVGSQKKPEVPPVRLASARASIRDPQQRLDAEVRQILRRWKQSPTRIRSLEMDFEDFHFNHSSEIVTCGSTTLYFQAPDKIRLDFRPAEPSALQQTVLREKGPDYEFKQQPRDTWIYSDAKLLRIDDINRSYTRFGLPSGLLRLWKNAVQMLVLTNLPAHWRTFSDTPVDERFHVTILNRSDDEIRLVFEPRRLDDSFLFEEISITLDARTHVVKMTDSIDTNGTSETLQILNREQVRVNQPWRSGDDPFRPNLDGYRQR